MGTTTFARDSNEQNQWSSSYYGACVLKVCSLLLELTGFFSFEWAPWMHMIVFLCIYYARTTSFPSQSLSGKPYKYPESEFTQIGACA